MGLVRGVKVGLRWTDLISETPAIALSATDGELYTLATEQNDTADYDGYRVEPALALGGGNNRSVLTELWFSVVSGGDYNLYVYHRSGDTEAELTAANWVACDEVSLNEPANAVCRLNNATKSARLHQIKWGTDAKDEYFSVNQIEFVYQPESRW
jgi:hypothetical protein